MRFEVAYETAGLRRRILAPIVRRVSRRQLAAAYRRLVAVLEGSPQAHACGHD